MPKPNSNSPPIKPDTAPITKSVPASPSSPLSENREVGFVVKAQDYLIYLEGLPSVKIDDIIESEKGGRAIITALDHEKVEALMLDRERPYPGNYFYKVNSGLLLPTQARLLGRTVNPLGVPLDGLGNIPLSEDKVNFDFVAPGVDTRKIIFDQLHTGITMVDTLLPIGKGQRELIFGEPRSGKNAFILDIILNQKGKSVFCIYVFAGKAEIDVKKFVKSLSDEGGLSYTAIIAATSSDSAPLISIAPSIGLSIAEYFVKNGREVLIIIDDLGLHAKYLREIGLLAGRVPGRESYPADIFYAHSHLMERAGNFNLKFGNSSITLLPVIETDLENFTALIPTNVMSMTDGHILFSAGLRSQGYYPAIVPERSVTRVGHQTQRPLHKILADKIRFLLAEYHELERYGRFGSELTADTQKLIKTGTIAIELLKQEQVQRIDLNTQILLMSLLFTNFFDNKDLEFVKSKKSKIIEFLKSSGPFKLISDQILTLTLDTLMENINKNLAQLDRACK